MIFTKYARGMVYWCNIPRYDVNPNMQSGRRPAIIVSNNIANCLSNNITIVPCTTNTEKKPEQPTHLIIPLNPDNPSLVLCENVITVNKNLLDTFMGILDVDTMKKVDKCLMAALGLIAVPNPFENKRDNKPETEIKKSQHKKNVGKRVSGLSEMKNFLSYCEQNGIEQTMKKYSIPTRTAVQQRVLWYKKKLGIN